MSLETTDKRLLWADACRIFAIFGVLVIHSCGEVFYGYGKIPFGHWLAANLFDSFARVAVPLFVMISGSLLLNSSEVQEPSFSRIGKRIAKVFIPLVVWSAIYLWWVDINTPNKIFDAIDWLQRFLTQPVMYHLWFVYMIVGIYILLPIYQVIFGAIEKSPCFQLYFFLVWIFINCLSIYIPMPFIGPMQIAAIFGYGGYLLLGRFLGSSRWLDVALYKWVILYFLGVCVTFLITWIRTTGTGIPDELAFSYFSPNVLLASVGAFMMIRKIRISNEVFGSFLRLLSDSCFVIYFVHVLVLEFLRYGTFGIKIATNVIHPFISIPLLAVATFLASLAIVAFIRVVPGSRRFLG